MHSKLHFNLEPKERAETKVKPRTVKLGFTLTVAVIDVSLSLPAFLVAGLLLWCLT